MEVAVARSRDNNKRVEDARRARVQWLKRLQTECASEEEFQTARSQPIWTELDSTSCSSSCASDGPSAADLERVRHANRLLFQQLLDSQPCRGSDPPSFLDPSFTIYRPARDPFFMDCGGHPEVGKKIGGGGQADIHHALYDGEDLEGHVLKVFKSDYYLADLQRLWMKNIVSTSKLLRMNYSRRIRCCRVDHGVLLQDGRFAFVLELHWGDLRKALDLKILKNDTHQSQVFQDNKVWSLMLTIAGGMRFLHEQGILHRDLKAANCFLYVNDDDPLPGNCLGADFDSLEGVIGTGFWRAPEVLLALKNKVKDLHSNQEVWTKKVDVYSDAMTCYEILRGCILFEG